MITEDEVVRLLKRADPAQGRDHAPTVDAASYLDTLRTRSTAVTLIDAKPGLGEPTGPRWPIITAVAAAILAMLVGALVVSRGDEAEIPAAPPTPAPPTTATPSTTADVVTEATNQVTVASTTSFDTVSRFVLDDFESGSLAGWREAGGGAGGWFVYSDGNTAPAPEWTDRIDPFAVPDPPQGEFAVVTDMNNPGTRILYRDVTLTGPLMLHLTVFYEVGHSEDGTQDGGPIASFVTPGTLRFDTEPNLQFRIDLLDPSAPFDSVADGDVLVNVFRTEQSDPPSLEPTEVSVDVSELAGQTVRLRLAEAGNQAPVRAGVDDIRFEPLGAGAGIALPVTPLAPGLPEADSLALPEPTGSHRVGTTALELGELTVSLWYPTGNLDGPPASYMTSEESRRILAESGVYGVQPDILGAARTHAIADAEPLDEELPLVVLSPGAGLPGSSLAGLAVDLASRGYAAAAVDHTIEANAAPTASGRAAEASRVVDELIASEFPIDADRIAMVGHSFGGAAALLAVRDDPRILAGVNLDGSFFPSLTADLDRPFLLVTSAEIRSDPSWTTTWGQLTGWRGWLTVAGTEHMSFTDHPILLEQLGFGTPNRTVTTDRTARITRDVVAAFVDLHLRGIPQPLLEGPSSQYPELEFREQ